MSIHEVEHIFQEGGELLVEAGVISTSELDLIRAFSSCLGEDQPSLLVTLAFQEALRAYLKGDFEAVGVDFAAAAAALCMN